MTTQIDVKTAELDFALLMAVYRGGIQRGCGEATCFEWGERPTGKQEDELVEALYYHLNAGKEWGQEGFMPWDAVEVFVAQGIEAATAAETAQQGSVHESPVANGDAPQAQPQGGDA